MHRAPSSLSACWSPSSSLALRAKLEWYGYLEYMVLEKAGQQVPLMLYVLFYYILIKHVRAQAPLPLCFV